MGFATFPTSPFPLLPLYSSLLYLALLNVFLLYSSQLVLYLPLSLLYLLFSTYGLLLPQSTMPWPSQSASLHPSLLVFLEETLSHVISHVISIRCRDFLLYSYTTKSCLLSGAMISLISSISVQVSSQILMCRRYVSPPSHCHSMADCHSKTDCQQPRQNNNASAVLGSEYRQINRNWCHSNGQGGQSFKCI